MMLSTIVPVAHCTCRHPLDCDHFCHVRRQAAAPGFFDFDEFEQAGDDGFTQTGCVDCTPGLGLEHLSGCAMVEASEMPVGSPEYA